MRVAILSQDAALYSTHRLTEAGLKRGHDIHVIDFLRCTAVLRTAMPQVWYKGECCPPFDAVIPRIGPSKTLYGIAIARQFEMMGVPVLNPTQAIACARDKWQCYQVLTQAGLPLPATGLTYSSREIETLLTALGSRSLVLKLLNGSHGVGVMLAETVQSARALFEAFRGVEADVLVQECMDEARGTDLRCFVINHQVVAAIQRKGALGEFRANLHQGGTAHPIQPTPEEAAIAVQAAQAIGLRVAGVDLLRTYEGPVVIEVNASPGLEGIEKVTQIDLADQIMNCLEPLARKSSI
ncbi:MAG: 30S ribosomal protein S6--L-glutamate ligase [Thermosynechococcaceae cyanobacterium]